MSPDLKAFLRHVLEGLIIIDELNSDYALMLVHLGIRLDLIDDEYLQSLFDKQKPPVTIKKFYEDHPQLRLQ